MSETSAVAQARAVPALLAALRRQPLDRTPIWIMRQAGRYLPEYRALRERHGFLDLARTPELAMHVTLMPLERMPLDGAILFADIALPLAGLGVGFRLEEGIGPVIDPPMRTAAQIDALRPFEAERDVPYVLEAIRITRAALASRGGPPVPLLGFAGAPFTLASYLVEGQGRRDFRHLHALMAADGGLWDRLMDRLAAMTAAYLRAQAAAGAQALQLFDSWAGALSAPDYDRYVKPWSRRVFEDLRDLGVPLIHFGTGTHGFLESFASAGGDVVGVDWHLPLDEAWRRIGHDRAIQGNLDPADLFAPWEWVRERARDVLRRAGGRPGHVFNLGHGILPGTPLETVQRLVDFVHESAPV